MCGGASHPSQRDNRNIINIPCDVNVWWGGRGRGGNSYKLEFFNCPVRREGRPHTRAWEPRPQGTYPPPPSVPSIPVYLIPYIVQTHIIPGLSLSRPPPPLYPSPSLSLYPYSCLSLSLSVLLYHCLSVPDPPCLSISLFLFAPLSSLTLSPPSPHLSPHLILPLFHCNPLPPPPLLVLSKYPSVKVPNRQRISCRDSSLGRASACGAGGRRFAPRP
jgi:hypothetical protein